MEIVEQIKVKLIDEGYSGLYYDGECACEVDDLAPCGECEREPGNDYINGCEPGYKFTDPEHDYLWVIKNTNTEPTEEQWESARREYL